MSHLQLELKPDSTALVQLASAVERFAEEAGLPLPLAMQLNLVLDELVTNTIDYGFAGREDGYIRIELHGEAGRLRVDLQDNGVPFDPTAVPPPDLESDLEQRRVGGLGLHFVRELMERVEYCHEAGENRLRLERALA